MYMTNPTSPPFLKQQHAHGVLQKVWLYGVLLFDEWVYVQVDKKAVLSFVGIVYVE